MYYRMCVTSYVSRDVYHMLVAVCHVMCVTRSVSRAMCDSLCVTCSGSGGLHPVPAPWSGGHGARGRHPAGHVCCRLRAGLRLHLDQVRPQRSACSARSFFRSFALPIASSASSFPLTVAYSVCAFPLCSPHNVLCLANNSDNHRLCPFSGPPPCLCVCV